ncbi:MAG: hypothetical protein HQL52_10120 [Magnetococcales bacterium]|nr:hypothetical protein [Magnetococcales bacterium]
MFPDTPVIQFQDPLGDLLGAGEDAFHYTFNDAVKLAGHACPTVAGAFLLVKRAVEILYPDSPPQRGDIEIKVSGGVAEGVNGPMSQVMTLLTGAAAENGFKGLGGLHAREGLLSFDSGEPHPPTRFTFKSRSNGRSTSLVYSPQGFPPAPEMGPALQAILSGNDDPQVREQFQNAWRGRVLAILADGGETTVGQV